MKKRYVVIVFLTLCLFVAIFIGATTSQIPYDPWIDHNADGKINYEDLFALADHYGGEGTPINQAAVQFEGNISVPAAAFVPTMYWYNYTIYPSLYNVMDTNWADFASGVQLPHGATVTNFTIWGYDMGSDAIVGALYRYNITGLVTMAFASSPSPIELPFSGAWYDDTIKYPVVDNNRHAYFLEVTLPPTTSGDYSFSHALIEYEYLP